MASRGRESEPTALVLCWRRPSEGIKTCALPWSKPRTMMKPADVEHSDVEGLHVEGESFEAFCRNVASAVAVCSKPGPPRRDHVNWQEPEGRRAVHRSP